MEDQKDDTDFAGGSQSLGTSARRAEELAVIISGMAGDIRYIRDAFDRRRSDLVGRAARRPHFPRRSGGAPRNQSSDCSRVYILRLAETDALNAAAQCEGRSRWRGKAIEEALSQVAAPLPPPQRYLGGRKISVRFTFTAKGYKKLCAVAATSGLSKTATVIALAYLIAEARP
jgi:hypothetical protein